MLLRAVLRRAMLLLLRAMLRSTRIPWEPASRCRATQRARHARSRRRACLCSGVFGVFGGSWVQSGAIRRSQISEAPSKAIRSHPKPSEAIRSHPKPSEAIRSDLA